MRVVKNQAAFGSSGTAPGCLQRHCHRLEVLAAHPKLLPCAMSSTKRFSTALVLPKRSLGSAAPPRLQERTAR